MQQDMLHGHQTFDNKLYQLRHLCGSMSNRGNQLQEDVKKFIAVSFRGWKRFFPFASHRKTFHTKINPLALNSTKGSGTAIDAVPSLPTPMFPDLHRLSSKQRESVLLYKNIREYRLRNWTFVHISYVKFTLTRNTKNITFLKHHDNNANIFEQIKTFL